MITGFFRTTIIEKDNRKYFKYKIKNKLVYKEFWAKDIKDLKKKVESNGFLWGITDIKKAEQYSGDYKLKTLEGRYGEKVGE